MSAPGLLLTRPEASAATLRTELAQYGYAVYNAPMLDIYHHGGESAPSPHDYQAIVITSANAAAALQTLAPPAELPVFAVGDASAQAAGMYGMRNVVSARGNSRDLRRLITARCKAEDSAILYIRGRDVTGNLPESLRDSDFAVDSWIAYTAEPVAGIPEPAADSEKLATYDAVLFFSKRTARHFAELVRGIHAEEALRHTRALCISHKVLSCIYDLPWAEIHVARRPDRQSMIALARACVPVH